MQAEYVRRGYGRDFATRKEKVSRWTRAERPQVPSELTQLAMAAVVGIPAHDVVTRGWPQWLLLALPGDHAAWTAPWTTDGAVAALDDGGPVDRRRMLIASTSTVGAIIAQWATALPAPAQDTGRGRIGTTTVDHIDTRLAALRLLDDDLGADHVYDIARAEIGLIRRLITERSYSLDTHRRLWSAAAEASRLAGWCAYDSGNTAAAEQHFVTSARAAAEAGDTSVGAVAAAFWANARYGAAQPDPGSAVDLTTKALAHGRVQSPRVVALLKIRQARAHSIAGNATAAYAAIDDALSAYQAGDLTVDEDVPQVYWITVGEILQSAGSAAQSLGDPGRALAYYEAAAEAADPPYNTVHEPRGAAIYQARRAEAYLDLGDVDGAVETARHAVELMGGVSSARASSTLAGLHSVLARHRRLPLVADFLEETG
ncbi:transcriptional regulator [Streptomyces sp. NBC_00669]|uniref:transcriptional regulator n=1 Tax=Streptomyces sp. NBC_00669 TaxID=2976011 RepID=UPI002E30873C|nr:transcriptional regulator [Streptomyces sp. NBC_00669]